MHQIGLFISPNLYMKCTCKRKNKISTCNYIRKKKKKNNEIQSLKKINTQKKKKKKDLID